MNDYLDLYVMICIYLYYNIAVNNIACFKLLCELLYEVLIFISLTCILNNRFQFRIQFYYNSFVTIYYIFFQFCFWNKFLLMYYNIMHIIIYLVL